MTAADEGTTRRLATRGSGPDRSRRSKVDRADRALLQEVA